VSDRRALVDYRKKLVDLLRTAVVKLIKAALVILIRTAVEDLT
jgi:hypothetical protein